METIARSDAFVHLNRLLSLQISRCFGKCESARQIGRTLYESCSVKRCFSLCEFCCADRYLQKSKYDDIVDTIVNFFFFTKFCCLQNYYKLYNYQMLSNFKWLCFEHKFYQFIRFEFRSPYERSCVHCRSNICSQTITNKMNNSWFFISMFLYGFINYSNHNHDMGLVKCYVILLKLLIAHICLTCVSW